MSWKLLVQYLLPQHILSRLITKIANCRIALIKNFIIKYYCKYYQIDLSEAVEPHYYNYPTFNAFFTRALKPEARPITPNPQAIVSPVDGKIWQLGRANTTHLEVKGKTLTIDQLLAEPNLASRFHAADFIVLYLAPSDYHRVHMPVAGKLWAMHYVPGKLFSVNPSIVNHKPDIFAQNERVISLFDTAVGPMAIIFVGAIFVGSIETTWSGVITPSKQRLVTRWDYQEQDLVFAQGMEIGRFRLGSTVILLFPQDTVALNSNLQPGTALRMGQNLGVLR